MTDVSNAALLQAYKDAIEANEDGIAELLKTVILELMGGEKLDLVTIGATDEIRPAWTNGPIISTTADAVRDWDDGE